MSTASTPYRLTADTTPDPILVEIVEGYLASVEKEVETAIGRTSRSPMIRDAHDYRAGIHDRHLRKLTGRSYSALVHPVVRDYPIETMRPGDVFFHNDVYLSEGGIGHLPDLCVTAPVFHDSGNGPEVVAFVQAFGHHDDIGGAVPGSMPSNATSVFEEGLMVPPIKLWDQGVPCEQALKIMTRNSRMPDSLAADLDAECSACLMGARRMGELFTRYGKETVEACFDAVLDKTTATFRREILSKIPEGTYVWEDYAEHDGVDEPRLHTQRITLTRTGADDPGGERLVIDFHGTAPQAKGPINHCGDYADGNFLKKWLAPILRNLADSPERMAELDVNEGIVPLIEMKFPEKGTLLTPIFLMFSTLGLTNNLLGLAIVHTTIQLPFSLYIMRNAFESVPRELEEAALVDGASSWQVLRRVFMPNMVPAVITVTLFAFGSNLDRAQMRARCPSANEGGFLAPNG